MKKGIILTCLSASCCLSSLVAQVSFDLNTASPPTSGFGNTAIGGLVLPNIVTGVSNTGTGLSALNQNTNGNNNVANGQEALLTNNIGNDNIAVGFQSLLHNTSGNSNIGIGSLSLWFNDYGSENTSVGHHSMYNNIFGESNVASGAFALYNNTEGHFNVATGHSSLFNNLSGIYNVASGFQALYSNVSGNYNTSNGAEALYNNIASNNSALGYRVLYKNTTGEQNLGAGAFALTNNTTGLYNTALGSRTLFDNQTGGYNTAVGYDALNNNVNGNTCSAYGYYALNNNVSGNANSAFGYGADMNNTNLIGSTALGYNAIATANNQVWIGENIASIVIGGAVNWSNLSDGRFKENIKEDVPGLNFITKLRPVSYNINFKKLDEFTLGNMPENVRTNRMKDKDYSMDFAITRTGFIAQEVEKAAMELGYDFDGVNSPKNETDHYSISYSSFIMPLVKAVQEQQVMIEEQKYKNEKLEKQLAEQMQVISELQQKTGTTTGTNQPGLSSQDFNMEQNVPNPFSNETTVRYKLPKGVSNAQLNIYDLSGKQLTTLPINEKGSSAITITSDNLAAGIYIYSIVADGKIIDSKRMIVANK